MPLPLNEKVNPSAIAAGAVARVAASANKARKLPVGHNPDASLQNVFILSSSLGMINVRVRGGKPEYHSSIMEAELAVIGRLICQRRCDESGVLITTRR